MSRQGASLPEPWLKRRWSMLVLVLAALWHAGGGMFVLLVPSGAERALRLPVSESPGLWGSMAAASILLGAAYAAAALDPARYRVLPALGLVANGLALALFPLVAWEEGWGLLPAAVAWGSFLVWAVLFGAMLRGQSASPAAGRKFASVAQALRAYRVSGGRTLFDLSLEKPVLLVFLRHAGCTFCREALGDLAAVRDGIGQTGSELVLVQMGSEREGLDLARRFGLNEAQIVSDPERELYQAFELRRGSWRQVLGWKVLANGIRAALRDGYGLGLPQEDPFQMPGAFLVHFGRIVQEFRHRQASDRPDYLALASCSLDNRRSGRS